MGSGPTETPTATPAATTSAATSERASAPDEGFAKAGSQDRGGSSASGPAAPEVPGQLDERVSFRISLVRNAHYHEDRERFFARLHRVAMFIVVASGTASFAFVRATPLWAGVTTLAGLIDLVFDVSGKARLHASLRRRIYDLLAQSEDDTRPLPQLREQAVRIYADEPPCMHAVNALAYNAAMLAFNRPQKYLFEIRPFYRIVRHWYSFTSAQFKTREEIELEATKPSLQSNAR